MKRDIVIIVLVILGFLLIGIGVLFEVREMLIDHYCYELTPYEFNRTPICEKYKDLYYSK